MVHFIGLYFIMRISLLIIALKKKNFLKHTEFLAKI